MTATPPDETALTGGGRSTVTRRGDVVLRPARPWSRSVAALLHHLEDVGFEGSPRLVGDGFAADGREAVEFVPGGFVHPHAWSDDGAAAVGELLRRLHEATATFVPRTTRSGNPGSAGTSGGLPARSGTATPDRGTSSRGTASRWC